MCNCKNCGAPLSKNRCLYCGTEYLPRELIYGESIHTSRESSRGSNAINATILATESIRGSMMRVSVIEDICDAQIKEAHISYAKIKSISDDVRYTIGK